MNKPFFIRAAFAAALTVTTSSAAPSSAQTPAAGGLTPTGWTSMSLCPIWTTCFDVVNTDNSGAGSLHAAIDAANVSTSTTPKLIRFDIPGAGPHTIQLTTPLPRITADDVHIDGYSQPGAERADYDTCPPQPPVLQVVLDGSNLFGQSGINAAADGLTVAGLVIQNFPLNGVLVYGDAADIDGNFVGVEADGVTPAGNGAFGVRVHGDDASIAGNLIGDNGFAPPGGGSGVYSAGLANHIVSNSIGVSIDGSVPLGNDGDGVSVYGEQAQVGDVGDCERNLIAYNGGDGVRIFGGVGHSLRRNGIFENDGAGIDLGADGVTPNDGAFDVDTGTNGKQNFPVLLGSQRDTDGKLVMDYVLRSKAHMRYMVEFFATATCDPTGRGEGGRMVGSGGFILHADARRQGTFTLTGAVSSGEYITATATEWSNTTPGPEEGSTSEFSRCYMVP